MNDQPCDPSVPPRAQPNALLLKQALLLLWAVWLTVVFVTNVLDGCKALGILRKDWAFASGNYHFLEGTTARYGPPAWLNALLFWGVLCWEGFAAVLFWLAWACYWGESHGRRVLYAAFTVSVGLWLAFMVAEEVCIAYDVEGTHLRLLIAQLATLLVVGLLPEEGPAAAS
jgi:hypothetical protein